MDWIANIMLRFAHLMGIVYVPKWDTMDNPVSVKAKKPKPKPEPPKEQAKGKEITHRLGGSDFGRNTDEVTLIETGENGDWSYEIFDGSSQSRFDFSDWSEYDEEVIAQEGWKTEHRREQYKKVRPHVLAGKTNAWVAKKFGMSQKWAEDYCTPVRRMTRNRKASMREGESPTPPPNDNQVIFDV